MKYIFNLKITSINLYYLGERTLNSAKKSIRTKYSLLRYFYTQLYFNSLNGGSFFQPLAFQFPEQDEFVLNDKILNEQIMLGNSILFNPILQKEENNVTFAFPNENWNRYPKGELILKKNQSENLKKENFEFLNLTGKYDDLHLFIRGGSVVPFYDILEKEDILRSKDLENTPLSFIINPDENGFASGDVIFDNPNANPYKTIENKEYLHVKVSYNKQEREILFNVLNDLNAYANNDVNVSEIIIYNHFDQEEIFNLRFLNEESKSIGLENENILVYKNDNNLHLRFANPIDIRKIKKIA